MLVLLGIARTDIEEDAAYLARKLVNLRIFDTPAESREFSPDERAHFPVKGFSLGPDRSILVVSQFTLYGDVRKGRSPSFDRAAPAAAARRLYESFIASLRNSGAICESGRFQEMMAVESINYGPFTILIDSNHEL